MKRISVVIAGVAGCAIVACLLTFFEFFMSAAVETNPSSISAKEIVAEDTNNGEYPQNPASPGSASRSSPSISTVSVKESNAKYNVSKTTDSPWKSSSEGKPWKDNSTKDPPVSSDENSWKGKKYGTENDTDDPPVSSEVKPWKNNKYGAENGTEDPPVSTIKVEESDLENNNFSNENDKDDLPAWTIKEEQDNPKGHRQDFAYDRQNWDKRGSPRIVLLASTHKEASSTIQQFFVGLAGITVKMQPDTVLDKKEEKRRPNPFVTDWAWPIGATSETPYHDLGPTKSFAPFGDFITVQKRHPMFPDYTPTEFDKMHETIAGYFRSLLRSPWEDGKKLVFGTEGFDNMLDGLLDDVDSDRGEETHVPPDADTYITNLLDLLPWAETDASIAGETLSEDKNNINTNKDSAVIIEPLQFEDIEVHIHHRTPRMTHLVSLWHQAGRKKTLRDFLVTTMRLHFIRINPLAVALQYARGGLRTTIVDMRGALDANRTLQEVAACDVLKMGDGGTKLCDDGGTLRIPDFSVPRDPVNRREDRSVTALTDEQMDEIDRVLDRYDCGVWQHLRKYQRRGIVRVLYPSDDLFATCDPEGSRDISYGQTLAEILEIASRENGISGAPKPAGRKKKSAKKQKNSKKRVRRRVRV